MSPLTSLTGHEGTSGAAKMALKAGEAGLQAECPEPVSWALELGASQSKAMGPARKDADFSCHSCPLSDSP